MSTETTDCSDQQKIQGGFYLKARCIQESEIARDAPCVREIWDFLIKECNHADNERLNIRRGQCFRSISDIQEGLSWYIGFRKMTYSKDQCEKAMKRLRSRGMIATTKTTRGLIITVLKYDYYQDISNYEGGTKTAMKATARRQGGGTINKNEKNEKNKYILPDIGPFGDSELNEKWKDWVAYRKDIKKQLTLSPAEEQIEFLEKYPPKVAVEMISQSIRNSWQGLFEIKKTNNAVRKEKRTFTEQAADWLNSGTTSGTGVHRTAEGV